MAERFPPDIDMNTPSIARMYDYLLGGKDNFEVDRKACNVLLERIPELLDLANGNRSFLSRAVSYVASQGVEQFLDLGAGLPTADNTHHVAQKANPRARVVYVDHDPIVLAHGRALLSNTPETAFLLADIREPEQILNSSQTRRLIDPELPVCVMLVSLLHCIPDGEAFPLAHELISSLPSGSYVIYSHIVSDDPEAGAWVTEKILSFGTPWGRVRSPEEASVVFEGLELVSPWPNGHGEVSRAVDCQSWRHPGRDPVARPVDPEVKLWELSGVAVKP